MWGIVPGLGALQRGEARQGLVLLGLDLCCVLSWFVLWHSQLQPLCVGALLILIGGACWLEIQARTEAEGLAGISTSGQVAEFIISLAMPLEVYGLGTLIAISAFPRVGLEDQQNLLGGSFLVEHVEMDQLRVDDLVVVGRIPAWWQVGGGGIQIASVLALAGQTVTRTDRQILVDGAPPLAHTINNPPRVPRIADTDSTVPPGKVAIYTEPIRFVGPNRIAGRLWLRWRPAASRGPIDWPPGLAVDPSTPDSR